MVARCARAVETSCGAAVVVDRGVAMLLNHQTPVLATPTIRSAAAATRHPEFDELARIARSFGALARSGVADGELSSLSAIDFQADAES
jgi:hypothetical protein